MNKKKIMLISTLLLVCSFNGFAHAEEVKTTRKYDGAKACEESLESIEVHRELAEKHGLEPERDEEYDKAFAEGFRQGHEKGWLVGYHSGRTDGYNRGISVKSAEKQETSETNNINSKSLPYYIFGLSVFVFVVFALFKWS